MRQVIENWQRGFVLHRKAYSETSLLVELFTEETGRLTVLAKGARAKRSALKGILQPLPLCYCVGAGAVN